MKKISYLIYILFFSFSIYSQNIFDTEHSEKYADYLYENSDFYDAADEYKRLVEMAPDSFQYKKRLLFSYKFSDQSEKGINHTEKYFGKNYSDYTSAVIENYLQMSILYNNCISCEDIFAEKLNLSEQAKSEYILSYYLLTKQYNRADSLFLIRDKSELNKSEKFNYLIKILKDTKKTDFKKPIIASVLSVIIPGSGKAYANDFKNGTLAFSVISLYAWQSYRAFSNDGVKSFYGWTFGALASGFYLGNIYGSYKSAERENNYQDELIKKKVKNIIIEYN